MFCYRICNESSILESITTANIKMSNYEEDDLHNEHAIEFSNYFTTNIRIKFQHRYTSVHTLVSEIVRHTSNDTCRHNLLFESSDVFSKKLAMYDPETSEVIKFGEFLRQHESDADEYCALAMSLLLEFRKLCITYHCGS